MFFDSDGIVGAALDTAVVNTCDAEASIIDLRAIVRNDHTHGSFDCANACHNTSGRYFFSRIHLMAGKS